eukprot:SAG22_NODE_2227_length_2814_cov_1.717127_2_plen_177_part_00
MGLLQAEIKEAHEQHRKQEDVAAKKTVHELNKLDLAALLNHGYSTLDEQNPGGGGKFRAIAYGKMGPTIKGGWCGYGVMGWVVGVLQLSFFGRRAQQRQCLLSTHGPCVCVCVSVCLCLCTAENISKDAWDSLAEDPDAEVSKEMWEAFFGPEGVRKEFKNDGDFKTFICQVSPED